MPYTSILGFISGNQKENTYTKRRVRFSDLAQIKIIQHKNVEREAISIDKVLREKGEQWIRNNARGSILLDLHKEELRGYLTKQGFNPFEIAKYVDDGYLSLEDDLIRYERILRQIGRIERRNQLPIVKEKLKEKIEIAVLSVRVV